MPRDRCSSDRARARAAAVAGRLGAGPRRPTTVYAVPTTVQFMNHADDRLRGMSTNPFNLKAQAVILNENGKEKGNGPFPGDDILYSFKLYAEPEATTAAGHGHLHLLLRRSASSATCDSYFDLAGGAAARVRAGGLRRHPASRSASPAARQVPRRARRGERDPGREERRAARAAAPGIDAMRRLAAAAASPSSPRSALAPRAPGHSLTIYAVATKGQYANHADDRARGVLDNPFNADENKLPANGKATRAGDNALIALQALQRPVVQEADRLRHVLLHLHHRPGRALQRGLRAERRRDDRLRADELRRRRPSPSR